MKKRIVIKVGTNVLTKDDGSLDKPVFRQIVVQLVAAIENGWQPVLVSSGAVGAGQDVLKNSQIQEESVRRQVLSAIGQASLMKRYYELFHEYDLVCAQVLATKEDFAVGDHYENMRNCFEGLLRERVVPIVNENDVVSLTELMFTDNDELAGLTARMIGAGHLVLLTNVDGVYDDRGVVIPEVSHGQDYSAYVLEKKSDKGRGGMASKYRIAVASAEAGIKTIIANGKSEGVLNKILQGGAIGTAFT